MTRPFLELFSPRLEEETKAGTWRMVDSKNAIRDGCSIVVLQVGWVGSVSVFPDGRRYKAPYVSNK